MHRISIYICELINDLISTDRNAILVEIVLIVKIIYSNKINQIIQLEKSLCSNR